MSASVTKNALHTACFQQDAALVREQLMGIKPSALNKKLTDYFNPIQGTPLHLACANGNLEIVKLLVEAGADLELKDVGRQTPLFIALSHKKEAVATYLIHAGANVLALGAGSRTTLHYACISCGKQVIELLLLKGVSVNQLDSGKGSALEYTACSIGGVGNIEAAEVLIKHGIDQAHITSGFRWACWRNTPRVAEYLIANGADYRSETTPKSELLFWVCGLGHIETVKLLLSYGVDFQVKVKFRGKMATYNGSPLDRARELQQAEIVALLEAAAPSDNCPVRRASPQNLAYLGV